MKYMACSKCDKTISEAEAHPYQKKKGEVEYFCPDCKRLTEQKFQQETENPNYVGAVVIGALAAIAGGALWYLVEVVYDVRIGYVAIAVGFMVGWGVILGAGKRRGEKLQLISAVISLVAVVGASYYSLVRAVHFSSVNISIWAARITPMTFFIWALAVYVGYRTPKARKL